MPRSAPGAPPSAWPRPASVSGGAPAPRPVSGPRPGPVEGLILRELGPEDGADLPQAIVLRELPVTPVGRVPRGLPPEPAPISAAELGLVLEEVEPDDGVPLIDGFEATTLETRAPRARAPAPPPPPKRAAPALEAFPTEACPNCGTPTADPRAAFCDACGERLPRVRRAAAPAAGDRKICRRCGLGNALDKAACTNCGQRL